MATRAGPDLNDGGKLDLRTKGLFNDAMAGVVDVRNQSVRFIVDLVVDGRGLGLPLRPHRVFVRRFIAHQSFLHGRASAVATQ